MRRSLAAARNEESEKPNELLIPERLGIHVSQGPAARGGTHPEFLGFLGERLNLSESDAVEVLGRLLSEYRAKSKYEISMLSPVRKCGERFEP
ncbi:MAG TPA: hypothetical protein VFQ61_11420 [Polyangiaceae bacterium]|nr:hypothetical protein [Polyangiaceae bacterium]